MYELTSSFSKRDKTLDPLVGSIMCWRDETRPNEWGHVAVVEKIEGGKVIISDSWYGHTDVEIINIRTLQRVEDSVEWTGQSLRSDYKYQGCILNPGVKS